MKPKVSIIIWGLKCFFAQIQSTAGIKGSYARQYGYVFDSAKEPKGRHPL